MSTVKKPRTGQTASTPTQKKLSATTIGIIVAAGIAVLGALAWFVGYPMLKARQNAQIVTPIAETTPDTTFVTPPDTTAIEEVAVLQETVPSVPKGYYIIVGSFRNRDNADRMVNNTGKDIALEVLHFEELGVYRVSAGYYESIRKAYNDAYSVKDLDGCANAWVLENR